jgi:hypothetical protein
MFIPFLAATALLAAFSQLGALTVKLGVLNLALKATAIAFLIAAMAAIALFLRGRVYGSKVAHQL